MSGTSLDGIDAALVSFRHDIPPELVAGYYRPLDAELRAQLTQLSLDDEVPMDLLAQTDAALGELFAECVLAVLSQGDITPKDVTAIGSHGITVRHAPTSAPAYTLQLGDANRIAQRSGIATVADFRRRDIAVGGQGAPLVPAFHRAVFADANENRIVLNIGGIANITVLPKDPAAAVTGFDTGPGNTLLDYWVNRQLGQAVDEHGSWGNSGACDAALLESLLSEPYFRQSPPKSTGKELFSPAWLHARLDASPRQPTAVDVQASLAHLTAQSIAQAALRYAPATERMLVCGGGVHNRQIMALLDELLPYPVESTAAYGLAPDWIEAMAFAWLARQTLRGLPGNLPTVTGARQAVVLGAIYPGR